MRILIELSHPAHFHFFKNAILELKKENEVLVIVKDKDIIKELVVESHFKNIFYLDKTERTIEKLFSLFYSTKKVLKLALKFKPDIFIGWNSIYSAFVSRILKKPFILFEDNEKPWNQLILRIPFATKIFTNHTYSHNFGRKHYRYDSYEPIAYLHPKYFKINNNITKKYNLNDKNNLIILRLISWSATHDFFHKSIFQRNNDLKDFINQLRKYGDILFSREGFKPCLITSKGKINISSSDFHHFLNIADLFIGEGGTSAEEAVLLGTPVIYISTLLTSYLIELHKKYRMVYFSTNIENLLEKVKKIFSIPNRREIYNARKHRILNEKIDLTEFIIKTITNIKN